MREDLIPTTAEGALVRVIEECAEVTKAYCKIQRFGDLAVDPVTGIAYDNVGDLLGELNDLEHAIGELRRLRALAKSAPRPTPRPLWRALASAFFGWPYDQRSDVR